MVLALDVEGHRKSHRGIIATGDASRLRRSGRIETRASNLVVIEPKSTPAPQLAVAAKFFPAGSHLSGSSGSPFARTS